MVSTAGMVIIATPKSSCAGTAARKITRNICGGMNWLWAISTPSVISVDCRSRSTARPPPTAPAPTG